jgi:RNA polymerase sigma factor (sigma-70 family)
LLPKRVHGGRLTTTVQGMDAAAAEDRALVAAMLARDPAGLDGAYRRYANRLHAYSRALLADGDAAADVVHDTFLIANERVAQLREPDRLGAWLYAIARSECLRRLRLRKRTAPMVEELPPPGDGTDPGRAVQAAEVRALVHAAAAGLNHGDREMIELAIRHDLSAGEIASVLGVSANHAHARLSRARGQLEAALGALLVARGRAGRCPELEQLLAGWDGQLTALWRKRIHRHVQDCLSCTTRRRDLLSPAALLSAYAALPFAAVALEHPPVPGAARSGPTGPAGSPGPTGSATGRAERGAGDGRAGRRRAATVAASVLLILLLGAVAVATAGPGPAERPLGAGPAATPPTAAVSAGPTDAGLGAASPSPAPTPSASPSRPGYVVVVVPFTARATARTVCDQGVFKLVVGAQTAGAPLKEARLYWRSVVLRSRLMDVTGSDARRTVSIFTTKVTWWVVATATDGRTATTPQQVATKPPC